MGLIDNGFSAADLAAVVGNKDGDGFGSGNGAWWILILLVFAAMFGNGSFGGGFGGTNGVADVQRGFDQQAVMSGVNGLTAQVGAGFANAEISRCNQQTNILQAINQSQAVATSNTNALAMSLQNCCCENRAATADLKYTIANEGSSTRAAIASNTQAILDKLCQQEIDALKTQNANLQTQLNLANMAASQTAQTAKILADNAAQTTALEQYLNPPARPAYIVANPNGCGTPIYYTGCGCGQYTV